LLEAEITAHLEHPGVVPIYGLVHDESGQPCYAMRLIEGQSFKLAIQAFHRDAPAGSAGPTSAGSKRMRPPAFASLAFRQLLQRFTTLCETIAYANNRGILHRDLKPGNVMLGGFGETLVIDWGLAKRLHETAGTPLVTEAGATAACAP